MNDLIETICENEYFRRKLIFTNNKPQKSKEVYDKVIKELNKKYESNFPFSVKQVRMIFDNCVLQCKRISLLQKTTSGVKNFVIYQFVSSRDSCQPQQEIEPTYSASASRNEGSEEKEEIEEEVATTSRKTARENSSKISTEGENSVSQTRFVPVKKN